MTNLWTAPSLYGILCTGEMFIRCLLRIGDTAVNKRDKSSQRSGRFVSQWRQAVPKQTHACVAEAAAQRTRVPGSGWVLFQLPESPSDTQAEI